MAIFIMLTKLNTEAVKDPSRLRKLERDVMKHVNRDCSDVNWLKSYATLGPYDYLDIFEAADMESALKVSALVRSFGHAHTEIWGAIDWDRYKTLIDTAETAS